MKVGISSYGAYVPLYRLDLGILDKNLNGERAIANFDEDSLTMGVAAGRDCLNGISAKSIDGLIFATTTPPYLEKLNSVTIALALNLRNSIITVDCTGSLRAGTTALNLAKDIVKAGGAKRIMVIASDLRIPYPGSEFERTFGDGAAAFIIENEDPAITIESSYSIADEIHDVWRADGEKFVRSWEERFTIEEGYLKTLPQAVRTLMQEDQVKINEITKVVYNGPNTRRHYQISKMFSLNVNQVQDPMFGSLGDCGAAHTLMILVAYLEEAKAGDRILVADYGNGANAMSLLVNEKIKSIGNKMGVKRNLESKKKLADYLTYVRWRGLMEMTTGRRRPPIPPTSASILWREKNQNISFNGSKCLKCGYVQYPPQRVCANCHSQDDFENYTFSGKKGRLITYGVDSAAPTPDPPQIIGLVNFDEGGRALLYITDKEETEITIEMSMELTFRKLFFNEGIHNYYWKCQPLRIKER